MEPERCSRCDAEVPSHFKDCPTCGERAGYPNVRKAGSSPERVALADRYKAAQDDATARGAIDRLREFESAVARSDAVIHRSYLEAERLATSENELYATYYQQKDVIRAPKGGRWDVLRSVADPALFPGYHEEVRFAALSLVGRGLDSYGPCALVLREDWIADRSTVFEENSVMWMIRKKIQVAETYQLPAGYRAAWEDRGRLAAAKLGGRIGPQTSPAAFAALLIAPGADTELDDFIEVHIYGDLTIRSFGKITVAPRSRDEKVTCEKIRLLCEAHQLEWEEAPWTP